MTTDTLAKLSMVNVALFIIVSLAALYNYTITNDMKSRETVINSHDTSIKNNQAAIKALEERMSSLSPFSSKVSIENSELLNLNERVNKVEKKVDLINDTLKKLYAPRN